MKRSYILITLLILAHVSFGGVVKGGVKFGHGDDCKGISTCKTEVHFDAVSKFPSLSNENTVSCGISI